MKVLIIGANGKIGRKVSKKLSESDKHKATAFIRKEEQREYFNNIGVKSILGDLENVPEEIGKSFEDYDAIVFTAGSGAKTGYDKTLGIDLDGAIKVIREADRKNAKRFVIVSASHSDDREFWGKAEGMKPYYIAKHYADEEVLRSNLEYTILRPVQLTDDEKSNLVTLSNDPKSVNNQIPREAVAETISQILDNESTYGKIIEMSEGPDEISKAIQSINW